MENKKVTYIDKYDRKEYTVNMPNQTRSAFLEERNKNYMNTVALTMEGREDITYEEFHERKDEYARALYKAGIRPEGLQIATNTPESIYLLYALDKIGCKTVGLSPLNTEYKMAQDINFTKPTRIITTDVCYGLVKKPIEALNISPILYPISENAKTPYMDNLKDDEDLAKIVAKGKDYQKDVSFYDPNKVTDVLFTGGSTGTHKGVDLIGNGLNAVTLAVDTVLFAEPGMTHLQNIPIGHMSFGRFVIHYGLAANLKNALVSDFSVNKFLEYIVKTKAHVATGGPPHWNTLARDMSNYPRGCISNLIQATSGGEAFRAEEKEVAMEALRYGGSNAIIGDCIGMTEVWGPAIINLGGKNTKESLGFSIPFVNTKIVDENYQEADKGHLLLNCPGMMVGYTDNEKENEKIFWYDEDGVKWYKTGDNVEKMGINNEEFKYLGRTKRNFVCGVGNVYPEQIEELLIKFPNVREAVVTKIPDKKYQYLPIYHISVYDMNFDVEAFEQEVNNLIFTRLGEHFLPGYITYTDELLPRTERTKLDPVLIEKQDLEKLKNGYVLERKRTNYYM